MKTKYKEIFKLKKMLEDAEIPFEWVPHFGYSDEMVEAMKRYSSRYNRTLSDMLSEFKP